MSDQDFVERLRIRWEAMGDMANSERAAAADEIEFLRRSQRELMGQVATLREERDEQDEHNARMDHILTRTANALRGKPPENGLHSWHDLPERVEQLRNTRDALEAERDELVRIANRLTAERDKARRMWCEVIWLQGGLIPPTLAADRGWDCYERKST